MESTRDRIDAATPGASDEAEDGLLMAAVLAAGIGSLAMGFFVILNEAGMYSAPALYGASGGVSGRTTFAVATWLIAWGILHWRWKGRQVERGPVMATTLVLIALGFLGTFPPVWGLF